MSFTSAPYIAGERALETLREIDDAAVRCFRPAARQLLAEVGDPEKALAMALARVTDFSAVKVGTSIVQSLVRRAPLTPVSSGIITVVCADSLKGQIYAAPSPACSIMQGPPQGRSG